MEIISVAIQKGGTGKTTTVAALTQAGVYKGKKVLAIDLDPQGNLSFALSANTKSDYTSYDLLTGKKSYEPQKTPCNVDIIPASWSLSTLSNGKGSATRLQKALTPIKQNYDLIIIDTPPTAGELQYNALQASTGVIIPLQADIYNLQSLYQITDTARQIQNSNKELSIKGFILTKINNRSTIAKQMRQNIIETANKIGVNYLGDIRTGVSIQESAALQKNLFEYAPKSNPAQDYLKLLECLI